MRFGRHKSFLFFSLMALLLVTISGHAQETKIMGRVVDSLTGEPIPFVNVYFQGTTIGVTSNFDGEFSINSFHASDTLIASYIGYFKAYYPVRIGRFNEMKFLLLQANIELSEVIIVPGENPAEVLLRKVINNKYVNNREKYEGYSYESYSKIEFDANNVTREFREKGIFKPFQFIFDNVDTSTINGKSYLPVFLTETISDIYFRRNPKSQKEVISANIISGVKNESISTFLGDMSQNINIYDNFLRLFQKNFVSPISDNGLNFYKYYLVDSLYINNDWCYEMLFKPRRKQELTFTGHFWIEKETYAVKKVDMEIARDANINYISALTIDQEFDRFEEKYWMLVKEKMVADFNIIKNTKSTMGFFGRKSGSYKNFNFSSQDDNDIHSSPVNVIIDHDALDKDKDFWEENRHDTLSDNEKSIYHMIDTLKTLPVFNTYVDIIKMITTGYYQKDWFEWGPYMSLVSFNTLEGIRFRIGGRTSNEFSRKIMLDAHIAYGIKDKQFKYGGGFLYMFNKNPRRTFSGSYTYDIEQIGASLAAFREDFLLAAVFRRNPADKLSMVSDSRFAYEHEWFNGFSNTINFIRRDISATGTLPFTIYSDAGTQKVNHIITTEIRLDTRLAYKENFIMGEFLRYSLGAKYPILNIHYGVGVQNIMASQYGFHRLQLNLTHWFNIGSLGWSKYQIEAGRIWGALPYPLLKVHEGNETYSFDEYAYNMMNYFEFISDKYVSVYYTHHFHGLFFNRLPLLRKLKWREVGFVRGLIGGLDERNRTYAEFPEGIFNLKEPYFECGAGIENIFTILRIDAVWRLSYLDHPGAESFGVRASLQFDF